MSPEQVGHTPSEFLDEHGDVWNAYIIQQPEASDYRKLTIITRRYNGCTSWMQTPQETLHYEQTAASFRHATSQPKTAMLRQLGKALPAQVIQAKAQDLGVVGGSLEVGSFGGGALHLTGASSSMAQSVVPSFFSDRGAGPYAPFTPHGPPPDAPAPGTPQHLLDQIARPSPPPSSVRSQPIASIAYRSAGSGGDQDGRSTLLGNREGPRSGHMPDVLAGIKQMRGLGFDLLASLWRALPSTASGQVRLGRVSSP